MKFRNMLLIALAGAMVAQPALAHRAWLLPSTFTLSGNEQWVTVDGAISNDLFFPNHVPMRYTDVTVTAPDGTTAPVEEGWVGKFKTSFDVKLDQQGTYLIGTSGEGWFARWEENGEPQRRRASLEELKADGIFDNPDAELSRSARKIETYVTLGAPSDAVFALKNKGLELQPITHPNDVYAGEEVSFQFMLDGAPAAGLEVEVVKGNDRYRDEAGLLTVTTNEDGEFSFTPDEAGRYWISTDTSAEGEYEGRAISDRASYVMTFEALPF
ncbi:MAG: ABC transporter permease [Ponticaulis sp.]|nr:ABC transporter permease [Ponticaulis sp.]